jgi:MFS family permease
MQRPFVRTPRTWLAYLALGYYGYLLNGLGPAMPFLRSDLHLSYAEGSLHSSAFALGMVVAGLLGDQLAHRRGRYAAMVCGLCGLAGGSVVLIAGPFAFFTLGGAFVMGSLGTLVLVLVPAIIADEHGPASAIALNEANVVSSTLAVLAPLIIGGLAHTIFGWRSAFLLGGLLLVPIAGQLHTLKLPGVASGGSTHSQGEPLPRAYWAYWLLLVCCISLEFTMIFWTADFLHTVARVQKDTASALVSIFLAAMVIGRIAGSRLTRVFRADTLLVPALAVTAVGFPMYWLIAITPLRIVGLFITGTGIAMLYPLALALALEAVPGRSAAASARATLASATAIGIAPLVLGGLADHVGIATAYSTVGVLVCLAVLTSRIAHRAAQMSRNLTCPSAAS